MDATISKNDSTDLPNNPDLTADLNAHTPAIRKIGEAVALVTSLKAENKDRSQRNGRIQEKYNAERPFSPHRLESDGLGWKANFSTKPLATLIDKVVPRFTTAIRNMKYLTASKLGDQFENSAEKSETFQREITETLRQHPDWEELLAEIAQENSLFGYANVGWLDTTSWFPTFYNQSDFVVPKNTKHTSMSAPVVCVKESYLLHELFELIRDRSAATSAGWDVDNVIESINKATTDAGRSAEIDPERIYADLSREATVLTSFQGAKTVEVWHVLVAEVDGHITHVAYDAIGNKQLFWKEKQFTSMAECASFYSFQHGNGKLHGSKGIGRELYNMASVLDRARNEVVDRLQLSGKLVLQCEENQIKRFRMSVIGNAILISSGYNVQQQKIDGNVEPFFALDRFLTDLLDQIAGSTSPKAQEGERVTKAAVEIMAAREEERRDAIIERFLTQFARMVSTIQRRLCSERAIDDVSKQLQARLLKKMTREELDILSNQPAVNAVQDYSEGERQRIALIAQEARGNPLYNQHELEKRSLTARIDAEFAEQVLLPVNDPTEQNENVRFQKLELMLLQSGSPVEVSPRDNHALHVEVIQQFVAPLIQQAPHDPSVWPILDAIGAHAFQHVQVAESAGLGPQIAQAKQWVTEFGKALKALHDHEQKAQAEMQQQVAEAVPGSAEAQQLAAQGAPVSPTSAAGQQEQPTNTQVASNNERITLNYKDMPPSVQRQMEAAAGFTPATETPQELAKLEALKKPKPTSSE